MAYTVGGGGGILGLAYIQKFMVEFNIFYLSLNHRVPTQTVTVSFFFKYWRCLETAKYPLIIMNYCFLLSLQLLRLNFSKVLRVVIKGGERSVHLAIFSGKNPLSPMSI